MIIDIAIGDITTTKCDAIVNAANKTLLGGGGVDGAIHRAAGPELLKECFKLPILRGQDSQFPVRCEIGDAKITKGYNLPSEFVIHTVGPDCRKAEHGILTDSLRSDLHSCWESCLEKARLHKLKRLAFPSISTGVFAFPIEEAAKIAIATIRLFDATHDNSGGIEHIYIKCFSEEDAEVYHNVLEGN